MAERTAPECGCVTTGTIIRGMCRMHYGRWVHKTPKDQRGPSPRFDRDFWDFVDKSGECWVWTGATNPSGYGLWSDLRNTGERGLAHRISLARVSPPESKRLLACHRCNNPPCVNPAHMYWGTPLDNSRDVAASGGPYNKGLEREFCMRGHALKGDNLKITGSLKRRRCRTCENARAREKMRRLRARKAEHDAAAG